MLPISLIVPLAIGWARLQGERAGYFDAVTGVAIIVAAMAASLMLLAFVTIAPLASVEARNRAAEEVATERIRRLNRVYAVLGNINHVIVRERNLATVFEDTCRIAVEQGGFSAAWVALKPDTAGAPLTIAAEAGEPAHARALRAAVADPAFATSAPARALADGRLVIANGGDAGGCRLADCAPLAALAAAHGYRAVACFPLRSGDDAIGGVLVLSSPDAAWFDADEVRLLDEMAMDVGFAMDVSRREADRTRATAALRESQGRLERAVRAGNVGLWEWSLVSDTVYYSSQWKRQLGYEGDEIAADFEAWRSRIHPDDVDRAIAGIGEYLRGQAPHLEIEYRCRHKDGTYRHMLAHATVLLDERGTQVALLGAHVDVTHHTELQAQFLQSQKMESLGRLAGGIAHDFNNLLTIINGTADLALLRLAAAGERDDDWRGVRDAGERAATLTRQLLAFSRKQVLQVEVLDPNEVLAGIEGLLRRLIGEDVLLKVSLAPDAGRGQGRRRPDRAGGGEPRGQRPRRDAGRRHADDRDARRRGRRRDAWRRERSPIAAGPLRRRLGHRYRRGHGRRDAGATSSSRSSPPRGRARAPGSASRPCSGSSASAAAPSACARSAAPGRRSRSTCRASATRRGGPAADRTRRWSAAPRRSSSSRTSRRCGWWRARFSRTPATPCWWRRTARRRSPISAAPSRRSTCC